MTGAEGKSLAERVSGGDRRALAKAITLVESSRSDHQAEAGAMLATLAESGQQAMRIGLSGTPGVGKSTFIEAFGGHLTGLGLTVAVLAVDPSSARTGGAILGDKTRMPTLARNRRAFIRPSPSQSALGGVAGQTRAVIALCEGAGYDVVLVETVGVGQSETMVADMTDIFTLLLAPAGGDELQGVKRGIMERADLVLVNKADGDLAAQATRTAADYAGALRLMRRAGDLAEGFPKALTVSALEGNGIGTAWDEMRVLYDWRASEGHLTARRQQERRAAFRSAAEAALLSAMQADPALGAEMKAVEGDVLAGRDAPDAAAKRLVAQWLAKGQAAR